MTNRPAAAALLCIAAVTAAPAAAFAHAFLKTATPAVGSTITTMPAEVRIDFTEGVEPSFSTIKVTDAHGAQVDNGTAHLEAGDTHLTVGLKPLAPGRYTVSWHAIATDTHRTQGTFSFTVAPR